MKKSILMLMPFVALGTISLSSCGLFGGGSGQLTDSSGNPILGQLNVIALDSGYGSEWINNAVAKWEEENPGYKVNLTASKDAKALINKHMASSKNNDDLYISVGTDWRSYAAQGKFLQIDDLLEEEVDGLKIKDKVNDEYKESIYYTNTKGETHSYRLPWTSGIGGIYYNAKMFKDNGWDTWLKETYEGNTTGEPETYEQLLGLIEKIKQDNIGVEGDLSATVKPFVYTGQNTDYFDYAVFTWWGQIAGEDKINEFLKYENYTNYDASIKDSAYAALKEATILWDNIFKDSTNYVEGSASKSNHQAQQNFLNGYCAMMFNGEWVYNEMLRYTNDHKLPDSFDLKIMKTPTAPNAVAPNISYVVGEDQYIAIPATSKNADLAKSFIKVLVSDWNCENFMDTANGLMAFKWDTKSYEPKNSFTQSLINYKNSTDVTFTSFSSNLMYLSNIIDVWATGAMRPFLGILTNTTTVDIAFETIAQETKRNWDTWKKQAGVK